MTAGEVELLAQAIWVEEGTRHWSEIDPNLRDSYRNVARDLLDEAYASHQRYLDAQGT
jgi:hypothetical protein